MRLATGPVGEAQALALQASRTMERDLVVLGGRCFPGGLAGHLIAMAVLTLVLPLSGCRASSSSASLPRPSVAAPSANASPTPGPTPGEPQRPDAAAPTPTTVMDDTSAEAAVAVLRAYYDAIAARRYEDAYRLWWNGGRASNQTLDQFRNGFAETISVEATIEPPGRVEGAAGSRYVDVPVTVHARTRRGESQCFTGSYTLRRSEVEGGGEEQRRWHIYSASMRRCGT